MSLEGDKGFWPVFGMRDDDEQEEEEEGGKEKSREGMVYGCSSFFFREMRFFLAASIS